MKILHLADQHLRDKDIEEASRCLDFIRDTARKESVDLIVSAGDMFDSRDTKLDSQAARLAVRHISEMAEIAPVAIIIGTASHDGKAAEILSYVRGKYPVHVASRPEQIEMAGAVLTLIPQPTKQFFQSNGDIRQTDQDISQAMSALFAGFGAQAAGKGIHILVGHWTVSGSKLPTGQVLIGNEIEVSVDQMMLANPDLICLGHIHEAQQIGRAFYPAGIYRQNWGEMTPRGFWIHEVMNKPPYPVSHQFYETPCKKVVRIEHDFTLNGPPENFIFPPFDNPGAYIRLDFKVYQDQAAQLDREKIRQYFLDSGALAVDIRIVRVPRQTVRSTEVLKVSSLPDKIRAMAKLKGEEVSGGILEKAELLEERQGEELIAGVTG